MSSLGSLTVDLSANIASFQSAMEKASYISQQTAKKIETNTDAITKMERSFSGLQGMMGKLGAATAALSTALAGGAMFKAIVSETIQWTGEAVKLSRSLGITTQQASALNIAIGDVYVSMDTMLAGSARIAKVLATSEKSFTDIGVATREAGGEFRNSVDIMLDVNTYLGKMNAGTERNVAGTKIYGKAWADLSQLMKLNNGVMDEALEKGKKLGLLVDSQAVENMKKYKAAMNDFGDAIQSFKVNVGNNFIPPLTAMATTSENMLTRAAEAFKRFSQEINSGDIYAAIERSSQFLSLGFRGDVGADIKERISKQRYGVFGGSGTINTGNQVSFSDRASQIEAQQRARQAAADERTKELEKEASAAEAAYKKYEDSFAGMIKQAEAADPTMTALQKNLSAISAEIEKAARDNPDYASSIREAGKYLTLMTNKAADLKNELDSVNDSIKQLEESTKDMAGFSRPGVEPSGGFLGFKVKGPNKLNLSGPATSGGYENLSTPSTFSQQDHLALMESMQSTSQRAFGDSVNQVQSVLDDPYIKSMEERNAYIEQIQSDHDKKINDMEKQRAMQSAEILSNSVNQLANILMQGNRRQFEIGKAMAMSTALVQGALAIVQCYGQLGPIAGSIAAAVIGTVTMAQIATIESSKYQPRALGGPVTAGGSYLVGERGPELLTLGQSGFVTNNNDLTRMSSGGQDVSVTVVNQISTGVSDTVRAEIAQMMPAIRAAAVSAVQQAISSGTSMSAAVGRM